MTGTVPFPSIIDAHHHVWDPAIRHQPWLDSAEELTPLRRRFGLDQLAPLAAAAGVAGTVVVQTVTEPGETPELLALAAAGPLVAGVVGWTDLTAPGSADALAGLRELPGGNFLTGIRHPLLTEPDEHWLARPAVRQGLAAVAAAGLAFDLVLDPARLPSAVAAAAAVPGLTFVLDHLGNVEVKASPDATWAASFAALAELPNAVCKLSGILSAPVAEVRPYFALALAKFGPDRLMFGSDWPVCTLNAQYAEVVAAARTLTADLSMAEQEAILAGTARRVYRLA
ncbi:MAG TPA: amidohydrolase family protein [Streptosporangiaceae bacterium]